MISYVNTTQKKTHLLCTHTCTHELYIHTCICGESDLTDNQFAELVECPTNI